MIYGSNDTQNMNIAVGTYRERLDLTTKNKTCFKMDATSSIPGMICKFVWNVSQAHKLTEKCTHPFILNNAHGIQYAYTTYVTSVVEHLLGKKGSKVVLGSSAKAARKVVRGWTNRKHEYSVFIHGSQQAKGFLKRSSAKRAWELLK